MSAGAPVHMVACGAAHTFVALQARGLLAWGDNSKGQVGVPLLHTVSLPVRVDAFAHVRVTHVAGGSKHSAAVDQHGQLWTWGFGRCAAAGRLQGAAGAGA
jgi:alpha-tubulin suppressor-like RCC1 family protein